MYSIAIFGGTFDPVHNGHIQTSITLQSYFKFDSFYFLPCKIPTIKPPAQANNEHRVEMLKLAIQNHPYFDIDLREINRDSPSYMVETLQSFREEYQQASINLIIGYDAFLSLPQWHQWTRIIELANLVVIDREHYVQNPVPEAITRLLTTHKKDTKNSLLNSKAGIICFFDAGHYAVSSTAIRNMLKHNQDVKNDLPKEVYEYIKSWGLYQ
ncbi:nicotinate-nucleotide adenylyltransferase [Legionella quateirensis]|uniref:Probable nicotinate-nucleotide adenylyltransferase n=1 Tax=Legionella quateirensis TaxID=45072 RepID=A0A378L1U4_9GAMM|nr:nicotinate-nucleotide adenylyltransferase [Legionella quateirensis]KTD43211.1 nicotinate-nucleotide adenylyltransferase [Legionella quateirensis]STY18090.1 nicotinate-nucleotide adenylyltransferase [Legionella quateirensis]